MRERAAILLLSFFLIIDGCIEPFAPANIEYSNVLVVDGFISTTEKVHQVKLSRTAPLNEKVFLAETGAEVAIENTSGEKIYLNENSPGIYETQLWAGNVGVGYTLHIKTKDGKEYRSSAVTMKSVPAIDGIKAEFLTTPERGINITVDAHDPAGKTRYYRWDYVETYEIRTPFPSNYEWIEGNTVIERQTPIDHCWGSDTLRDVKIKSTRGQDVDQIAEFPLHFIPESSYIFGIKYSIFVQQFALDETTYRYWENLRLINETQGTLSDIQPGSLRGNVAAVSDPDETVLGYFDASAVSEQRVFFHYEDFEQFGYVRPTFRVGCFGIQPVLVPENGIGEFMARNPLDLEIWETLGSTPDPIFFEMMPRPCCDCTMLGTNVKPSFWE